MKTSQARPDGSIRRARSSTARPIRNRSAAFMEAQGTDPISPYRPTSSNRSTFPALVFPVRSRIRSGSGDSSFTSPRRNAFPGVSAPDESAGGSSVEPFPGDTSPQVTRQQAVRMAGTVRRITPPYGRIPRFDSGYRVDRGSFRADAVTTGGSGTDVAPTPRDGRPADGDVRTIVQKADQPTIRRFPCSKD